MTVKELRNTLRILVRNGHGNKQANYQILEDHIGHAPIVSWIVYKDEVCFYDKTV